jgi:carboxyvinyl-carboxyphosphonate phosphorylmutase
MSDRRDAFRALLAGSRCVRPAQVYDPLSARLAEHLGFEVGMIPGSDAALAVLGDPDIALITMTEFADQVHRVTRATDMPVVADGDHGYGNAINARRFVRELETVGLCAVTIEDTDLPAPYGAAVARLVPLAEAAAKLGAAVAGRTDPRFAVIGRTNMAIAAGGLDETIARLRAYEAAGVDALFVQGMTTRAEFDAVSAAVSLPFVLPRPSRELEDEPYLASRRARIAFPQGAKPIEASLAAVEASLIAQGGGRPAGASHAERLKLLTRAEEFAAARRRYLTDREDDQ